MCALKHSKNKKGSFSRYCTYLGHNSKHVRMFISTYYIWTATIVQYPSNCVELKKIKTYKAQYREYINVLVYV